MLYHPQKFQNRFSRPGAFEGIGRLPDINAQGKSIEVSILFYPSDPAADSGARRILPAGFAVKLPFLSLLKQ